MDALIFKYLEDDLSNEEREKLLRWLDESPANRVVFQNIASLWYADNKDLQAAKEDIWKSIENLTVRSAGSVPVTSRGRYRNTGVLWLKVAAAVIVMLVCGSILFLNYGDILNGRHAEAVQSVRKASRRGEMISMELPDGTKVKLNAESSISYPEMFPGNSRNVELTGEAFFDVTPDPDKPFIIHTADLNISVLGTSFNVKSRRDESDTRVAVRTGRVNVAENRDNNEGVYLGPQEMAVYTPSDKTLLKSAGFDETETFGWTEKILYFRNSSFEEITRKLARWYDVKFDIRKEIGSQKDFSGQFENATLEEVLAGLSFVFSFEYETTNNTVIIK